MNSFKKCLISLSLGTVLAFAASNSFAEGSQKMVILNVDKPNMVVNGQVKEIDPGKGTTPLIKNNRTLVPIRSIIEEMGGKIDWDSTERKVSISLNGKTVELWIDKDIARVNGEDKKLDAAAEVINERTMIPVRFASENLGLFVNWDSDAKSIGISNFNDFYLYIDGEKVSSKEYTYFFTSEKNFYAQNTGVEIGKDFWTTPKKDGKTPLEAVRKSASSFCRKYKMLMKLMKDRNYTPSQEAQKAVKESLDSFVAESGGVESANEIAMAQNGVSLDDKQEIDKNNQIIGYFMADIKNKLSLSDKDVQSFYEKNKNNFEEVTVQSILFITLDSETFKPVPQDKMDELKKQAEELLSKAKAGEDFKELVKKYCEVPGSKCDWGEYTFPRGQMPKEVEDWSFNAKPGDIGIVKSMHGYHVIKFIKKLEPKDMKDEIISTYYKQFQQDLYKSWETDPEYQIVKNQKEIDAIK